jgi:subtilisin
VELSVFRVFDFYSGKLGASNYTILKAMIIAALDQCDIINLSFGGGPFDTIVQEAVQDARNSGMLVLSWHMGDKLLQHARNYEGHQKQCQRLLVGED